MCKSNDQTRDSYLGLTDTNIQTILEIKILLLFRRLRPNASSYMVMVAMYKVMPVQNFTVASQNLRSVFLFFPPKDI